MKSEHQKQRKTRNVWSFVLLSIILVISIPKLALRAVVAPPHKRYDTAFPIDLYSVNNWRYVCQPRHIHLSQANSVDPNNANRISMTVSFSLDYGEEACRQAQPSVVYGRGVFSESTVSAGKPLQFNYTSSKSQGIFQSDYIYHVEIPKLEAGQVQYWYRIRVEQQPPKLYATVTSPLSSSRSLRTVRHSPLLGETDTFRFRTPPLPHTPTSIALVGDLGQTENSTRTMMHIWRAAALTNSNLHPITHLLIAGDMSYADSDPARWISWFELMEPLLRGTPLHVAAGNHEIECNNQTMDIFVPYENYFHNPGRIRDAEMVPITDEYRNTLWSGECSAPSDFQGVYNYGNSFYAYQHGLLHVIVLNSYTDSTEGSAQYQWLQEELHQRFDRQVTPWLLVSFHAPLYTTFIGHVDEIEATRMKQALEPVFLQHGVNLIVSGHDHAYMRTHSMAFGRVDATDKSPVYLTLGAGGNREQHSAGFKNEDEPEPWVAVRTLEDYGYGHLLVVNATHAHFRWVNDGVSQKGIQDDAWFINAHV